MAGLITAGSSSHAYKLKSAIAAAEIFLGDSKPMPSVKLPGIKFIEIPSYASPSFAHELLTLCLDNQITEVYPLIYQEVALLAESVLLFGEYGIKVFVPETNDLKKYLTTQEGLPVIHKTNPCGIFVESETGYKLFTAS